MNELKRLNIVFSDEHFEILQHAKGKDTWTEALVKWAKMVLKKNKSQQ